MPHTAGGVRFSDDLVAVCARLAATAPTLAHDLHAALGNTFALMAADVVQAAPDSVGQAQGRAQTLVALANMMAEAPKILAQLQAAHNRNATR